jgi:hypothetical protein
MHMYVYVLPVHSATVHLCCDAGAWCGHHHDWCACAAQEAARQKRLHSVAARFEAEAARDAAQRQLEAAEAAASAARREVRTCHCCP